MSLYKFVLVFVFLVSNFPTSAQAAQSDELLIQIDKCSIALFEDPRNPQKEQCLLQFSNNKNLDADLLLKIHRFEDLTSYNQKLRNKIYYFLVKIEDQKKLLIKQNIDMFQVNTELAKFENTKIKDQSQFIQEIAKDLKGADPLGAINAQLILEKEKLLSEIVSYQGQYQYLTKVRDTKIVKQDQIDLKDFQKGKVYRVADSQSAQSAIFENNSYKTELENVQIELSALYDSLKVKDQRIQKITSDLIKAELKSSEKDIQLKKQGDDIKILRQEFTRFETRFSSMQEILDDRDKTIDALRNDLNEATLLIAESNPLGVTLSENSNEMFNKLNLDYAELKSRFNLTQKTIEEQNKIIVKLKADLSDFNSQESQMLRNSNQEALIKDSQITELNTVLETYRKQLTKAQETIESKNNKIVLLSNEIGNLKNGTDETKKDSRLNELKVKQQDKTIAMLKNTIDHLRTNKSKESEYLYTAIDQKEKEITQIKGILNIYKDKLGEVNNKLVNKDGDMGDLEKQLKFAHKELIQKNEILQKTKEDLILFSNQLIELQVEVMNLSNSYEHNGEGVENRILSLQAKLGTIEEIIKKEIKNPPKAEENITIGEVEKVKNFPEVNVEVNQQ